MFSGFCFELQRQFEKTKTTENLENPSLVANKSAGCCFYELKLILQLQNFEKTCTRTEILEQETKIAWQNGCQKLVQVLKIGVLVFSSRVFENLKKNIENFHRFRNFRCFWVFVLRYRTDSKDGNDGKFKPNFSAKYMPRMLFL